MDTFVFRRCQVNGVGVCGYVKSMKEKYEASCTIFVGYLKKQEATSLAIDGEGWLHTGDMCYIDRQGLIYVVERIKELIKYKAYQVKLLPFIFVSTTAC